MRTCPRCNNNKIRNTYQQCYQCNLKDESSSSDQETPEIAKRESIPKTVRNALWINFFKAEREGKCRCCLRETISIGNFHAGHIKAHANGGMPTLDNLVPICMLCNLSCGKHDLNEFIAKYNLHYGL